MVTGPTVSLELERQRPALPPKRRRWTGWWKSITFRTAAIGVATVVFTVTVLWLFVSSLLGKEADPEAGETSKGASAAPVTVPAGALRPSR
jgi:uncharacterized membrane protein YdfJ with MMPL/SSD domain